ncbi:MAG: hypothetical protein ACK4HD_09240 [Pannonibacter phragmitetus]
MHNEVLTWQTVSENPYYEERSCGDAFPQYMISDLGLLYLVQVTTDGLVWSKICKRTNIVDARRFAESHLAHTRIIERIESAAPMEAVEVTPSELSIYTTRPVLSNADVPDSLRTELPGLVTETSPDRLEFTPPHDLATENAELRARLAAARERVIAIQSKLSDRIASVEKQEAAVAEARRRADAFRVAFIGEVTARHSSGSNAQDSLNTYLVHCEFGWTEFRIVRAGNAAGAYSAWRRACDDEDNPLPDFFSETIQPANHMQIVPESALLIRRLEPAFPDTSGAYSWCDPEGGEENHAGVARIVAYAERV